ncbi:LysR family transcriptional regulator [Pelagibius sp. Alg239-R121]|uniref:LysR family transcriptional regulator n=1 Tax=Pelagibius sp. Alg239-R121 TaxID=2993448 RepID=UPI0024A63F64|nr:LysR family transcriptional regulator [Pelagibius sp. Alg239-R121]
MILARDFHYFRAAYLEGSFRKAAEAVSVSPSSVNRLVVRLESRMGIELFRRTAGGLIPTEAAEQLFELLCRTSEGFDEILNDHGPTNFAARRDYTVIGTQSLVREVIVPGLRSDASSASERPCERDNSVSVKARQDLSDCFQGAVCEADIVIGFDLELTVMSSMEIVFERELSVGAVMHPAHPLAACRPLTLKSCVAHPFILPDETWPLHHHLEREIAAAEGVPAAASSSNAIEYLRDEVLHGGKIGFQTLVGLMADIEAGNLLYRPISIGRPCSRSNDFVRARDEVLLTQRIGIAARRDRRNRVQKTAIEKLSARIEELSRMDMALRNAGSHCVAVQPVHDLRSVDQRF